MGDRVNNDLLDAMSSLPFGERLRALRIAHGVRSQAALLALLESRTGTSRSAAWLSGIESGALDPTPERRQELVVALGLEGAEADLLAPSVERSPSGDHDLVAYVAWQGVRLIMADELIRDSSDAGARARGRAVRDRLRDVLTSDDELWTASGRQFRGLGPFVDLPDVTRWMLLVEATHMQPFLPFEPISKSWSRTREKAIDRIAEELDLSPSSDQRKTLHRQRVPGSKSMAWLRDHEPKALTSPTGSATLAALFIADPSGDARLMRGESSVGTLGWWASCGRYALAVTDTTEELSEPDSQEGQSRGATHFELSLAAATVPSGALLASTRPLMGSLSGGALSVAATREALARERLRQSQTKGDRSRNTGGSNEMFPGVGLLAALGPHVIRNDVTRLVTVYALSRLSEQSWIGAESHLPSAPRAAHSLATAVRGLRAYREEVGTWEASDSTSVKQVDAAADELERAFRTLSRMADLDEDPNSGT